MANCIIFRQFIKKNLLKTNFFLVIKLNYISLRPSKTDSAPVRGDGYELETSQSQRRDVAQRADRTWWWLWALRAVVKNFRMVRS